MPGLRDLPVAAVFVTDPESQSTPPAEALTRLPGLTGAEAGLAAAFTGGTSLQNYAEETQPVPQLRPLAARADSDQATWAA